MGKRILVVDDEPAIVRLIQLTMEHQGFQVATAYDGVEGMRKAETEVPDLIVLDVAMPRMDGFAMLSRLKAAAWSRDIPVIMLTAKAQDADVLHALQLGVICYITKPFNPVELIAFVKRMIELPEDSPQAVPHAQHAEAA